MPIKLSKWILGNLSKRKETIKKMLWYSGDLKVYSECSAFLKMIVDFWKIQVFQIVIEKNGVGLLLKLGLHVIL